jgi:hypothetical protein
MSLRLLKEIDFRNCEGFRTWRDVRLESVMRFKADVGEMNIAACSSR